jgi:acetyl/propionyl-CoA carboxylase alpha subunit
LISTLLIANRGEIAVRIAATATALGVRTVGVYTEHDRDALHVRRCDTAMHIPDYLDAEAIIAAAVAAGAEAIHPGFGFLAENADFASAVTDAGLIWVGPPPQAIEKMGSKAGARVLMAAAGVPVLPGFDGADQSDEGLLSEAERIGWPVIIKPSAGGGGKGMQVVESKEDFIQSLAEARRLAQSAFGDNRMVLEKYLAVARHIEVQVLADAHGHCIHLFERECSIQRRHQKVIEEAPSPAFEGPDGAKARDALYAHAVAAARAVDYVGAGTVEFIVDGLGQAYFLEMNTRIQVEHPVTECITGVDLVAAQLRVASGEVLPWKQADIQMCGWAMEARLYAENPDQDYMPSTGTIHRWVMPSGEGVRVDTGVEAGSEVTVHYDPMLAKVIVHGENRALACAKLVGALSRMVVLGVNTNRDHLGRILRHEAFVSGALETRFLVTHAAALEPADAAADGAFIAAAVNAWQARPVSRLPGLRKNWRNSPWRPAQITLAIGEDTRTLNISETAEGLEVDGQPVSVLTDRAPMRLELDGQVHSFCLARVGDTTFVRSDAGEFSVTHSPRFVVPGTEEVAGACVAPMPGKVTQVLVVEGESVTKGQPVVVLEAMKMESTQCAAEDGVVASVCVSVGDQVDAGAALIQLETAEA